ncbi:vitelline envelope sperm lysin receptor [Octopus bimaculoides]|nr:vitelline envelope sperm lysin receptor [Octopus bimaculoides]|eukprot:XP_014771224.1 PREDICTED: uncharacterized protein LOC106869837 [Octopus bimaculoides]
MYTIVSSNSVQLSSPKPSLNDMIQEVHMKSRRKLSLYIINIKGHPIKNVLNLGKKVQLRGEILDNIDGTNFVAENCWVYSRNSFYQFLHNGCGDGFIFPSNIGFISNYGTIKSPFFEVFRLRDSHRLWFQCIVKFCDNVCPRKLCLWRELTKNSRNEVRRKLIFKDNFTYTALNKRYSMQSEVFYVSDPSRPVSLPVVQSRMTNNSSVELWRGNIYLLLAVYSIYYSLLLVITF